MLRPLLGKTMEVYIDEMLVKSKQCLDHVTHLQEAFKLLRAYGMKLNPSKCAFEVNVGQFLSFMVTERSIEAKPTQLKAILESPTPSSRKGVQQLSGQLAALRRFISQFKDRLKPFLAALGRFISRFISQLAASGQGMFSFIDAFSGYHQIPKYPPDAEKTAFITPHVGYYAIM